MMLFFIDEKTKVRDQLVGKNGRRELAGVVFSQ